MPTRYADDLPEDVPDGAAHATGTADAADARPASAAVQPHDALFRQILGDVAHAAQVVRSILPARVAAHIDWSVPFEPTHASMVGDGEGQRHGDLLFKVRLVDGRGAFVWVMFEHQKHDRALDAVAVERDGAALPGGLAPQPSQRAVRARGVAGGAVPRPQAVACADIVAGADGSI